MPGDDRPLQSPMPDDAAAIVDAFGPKLSALLREAFEAIVALDRPAAELENDALSALSAFAGHASAHFLARLMILKDLPIDIAWPAVLNSVERSMQQALIDGNPE